MNVANDWGASGLLPALLRQQFFHAGCWWVVLVWLSTTCLQVGRWPMRVLFFATLWTLLLVAFPVILSGLGLAFQTPALWTVTLCIVSLWSSAFMNDSIKSLNKKSSAWTWCLVALIGWVLMLDSFGLLKWDVYAIGFNKDLLWVVWLIASTWAVWSWSTRQALWMQQAAITFCIATAVFIVMRVNTGNVWDAWVDPWLWLYAHLQMIKLGWQRARSFLRATPAST
jgi:hypothetical protein